MQYLVLENVSRSYGDKILFKNINLSVSKGDKIALVAKNGSGKTTLLKIIAGEEGSDGETSKITISKDIRTVVLKQNPDFNPEDNAIDAIFYSDNLALNAIRQYGLALQTNDDVKAQHFMSQLDDLKAWDMEYKVHEILNKLKITDLSQPVKTMSGGQQKRLALAKILIEEPDFLILDEPTNHLDIEMIEWLENYLKSSQLTLFMVTHDRYFLDNVCNEIIELDNGQLFIYRGNYSQYLEKRELRKENDAAQLEKTQKLYSRELEWMRRQPQARTTKAKSRIDDFYELKEKALIKNEDSSIRIMIEPVRLGSKILEAHSITKSFGSHKIIQNFSYKFKKGERVGIVGPNGTGKSTFLKILTQQIPPDQGKIVVGDTTNFGYYTQDGISVSEDKTIIDVIRDIAEYIPLAKGYKLTAESLLERFLFPRSQQRVKVSQLSGGEKRRLFLLTVLMKNPNFLILDEPTNDLDIMTLNILEDYLMDFPGCLIIVTHDRYFMDKLVDHIFVLEGDGVVRDYNGSYSEYRTEHSESKQATQTKDFEKPQEENKGKATYEQRKEFVKIEREIIKLEQQKEEVTAQFLNPSMESERLIELTKKLELIKEMIEEKELKWVELSNLM